MPTLTSEEKSLFVDEIRELRERLNAFRPENTLQSLERFENQLTLNEMEACFSAPKHEETNDDLKRLFSVRWERIRNSNMCYTQQPSNVVNQLCLKIAKAISPPAATAAEIKELASKTGPYFLLMPSLENSVDICFENIHSLGPHEFVLSDGQRVFIPVATCLQYASASDTGQLQHIVAIGGAYPELTPSELKRVSHHSKQAVTFYQSIIAFNKQRLLANDIGPKLTELAVALRSGGKHGHGGDELNAASPANLGILAFFKYWESFSEPEKLAIFTEEPDLKNVLGRLFRPNHVDYRHVSYCVELLAWDLEPIIQRYSQKPPIETLRQRVSTQESAFIAAAKSPEGLAIIPTEIPPKHILHLIFNLPIDEQEVLFKDPDYKNALMYALAHDLEALTEFKLDQKHQQQAILTQVNSALIVAAKQGKTDAIKLFLNWGAQIESHDLNNSTALHWAAYNGHVDAVTCLLNNGASLEARGQGNNTALNFAVINGRGAVVGLLLEKNANLNARTYDGKNALDIAIERDSSFIKPLLSFIKPLLMKLATLPESSQADCLLQVPGGPYDDIYAYVAIERLELLNSIMPHSSKKTNAGTPNVTEPLDNMRFDEHLKHIYSHYQRMKEKSLSNSNYAAATSAAKTLLIECVKAKVTLFQSDAAIDIARLQFRNTCKSAIEKAKPVLDKHQEWGKVIAAFLLAIITLPVSLPLYATGFFSVKTKSALLLDKLQEVIDNHDTRNS